MNIEKNGHLFNAGFALAVALVLSSIVGAWAYTHAKNGEQTITVTGSARKRIKSDLVIWRSAVTYQATQLSEAYKSLSDNIPRVKQYLISKGIREIRLQLVHLVSTMHGRTKKVRTTGRSQAIRSGRSCRCAQTMWIRSRRSHASDQS